MNKNIFSLIALVTIGGYSIYLYLIDRLGLYIHPRFFEEAFIAGIFGLAVSALFVYTIIKQNKNEVPKELILLTFVLLGLTINILFLIFGFFYLLKFSKDSDYKFSITNFVVLSILALMIVVPPTSLSSFTASQRVTNLSNINLTGQKRNLVNSFTNNTESFGLGDWIASFTYNPENSYYIGKKVKVSGFMFRTEDITNNDFVAARFVIACCAVDARPVGLKVSNINNFDFIKDRWIEVRGEFFEENGELKILPVEINYIDQPAQPYIF